MYWECSECGGQLKRRRPPVVCPSCGLAGVVFMPADPEDADRHAVESLREVWFRAGLEAASESARSSA